MRKIVYIHTPKCGGSSFGAALRLAFPFSQTSIPLEEPDNRFNGLDRIRARYQKRGAYLADQMAQRVHIIVGHVCFHNCLHAEYGDHYDFVTMLRDPAQRFVSHYKHLQRRHPDPSRPDRIQDFLETQDAQRLGSQYLFYFGGRWQCETGAAAAVQTAIDNLSRFAIVGDLAASNAFRTELQKLAGRPIVPLMRNRAPESTEIPIEYIERINQICAPDIEIYQQIMGAKAAA